MITRYNLSPGMRNLLKAPLIGLFLLALLFTFDSIRWTPPIWGGIAELKPVEVNGVKQWLLIRGKNKKAPVLLFLHGGPGAAHIGLFRKYQKRLEEKFIVVQWDQRGAGLSDFPDPSTLTLAQFVQDGLTVTKYLKERFQQEKIYLVGHSWGTAAGWRLARDYGRHYYAYAALAQMNDQNERIQYLAALNRAVQLNNQEAKAQLEALGPPPWPEEQSYKNMRTILRWIKAFKGDAASLNAERTFFWDLLLSPEYRMGDIFDWYQKKKESMKIISPLFNARVNISSGGRAFEIPFHMILGADDLITPSEPAANLYDTVIAPAGKTLIVYENSAHYIMWERTEEYQAALIRLFGVL